MGSLVLAVANSVLLVVVPVYEGGCVGVADYPADTMRCPGGVTHTTLVEENGTGVLWVLAVPLVLALVGTLLRARRARASVAIALGAFSLLTGFSIGAAYIPATVAMALAARFTPRPQRTAPAGAP